MTVIGDMCDARLRFLRGLSTWSTYGHGWGNRVEDVRRNAIAMARGARPAAPLVASASVPVAAPAHMDVAKVAPPPAGLAARLRFLVTGRA